MISPQVLSLIKFTTLEIMIIFALYEPNQCFFFFMDEIKVTFLIECYLHVVKNICMRALNKKKVCTIESEERRRKK